MRKPVFVTGLDIGSSKVAALGARIDPDGTFRILAEVTQAAKGVSRGSIVDLNATVDSVSKVLEMLREKISRAPENIYVNISSQDLKGGSSRGMVPLSMRGREVVRSDVDKCINVAGTIHLPFDREIIHRIVHKFSVDDQPWIKSALGLYASRLNCEVYIITANVNHIQNIYKCVNNAGYDVKEVVFTGIADGAAVLTKEEKLEGCLLLDIGATLTDISLFSGGSLSALDIIPLGTEDVGGDFKNSAAMDDIVSRVSVAARDFVSSGGKIVSVTLTGGMAFTDGSIEFLEEKLTYPIKMGVVKDIRGEISSLDSVRLSTAIGLAKYAYERHQKKVREDKNIVQNLSSKVVEIFNNYF